jgi:hypothetical protein
MLLSSVTALRDSICEKMKEHVVVTPQIASIVAAAVVGSVDPLTGRASPARIIFGIMAQLPEGATHDNLAVKESVRRTIVEGIRSASVDTSDNEAQHLESLSRNTLPRLGSRPPTI